MAPSATRLYQPRSVGSGTAFTVIFSVIAASVILGAFLWGFLIPYLRKRKSLRPHGERSDNVTIYNPRFFTPFSRRPSPPESIVLQTWTPPRTPRAPSPNLNTGQSPFTPVHDEKSSCPESSVPKSHARPTVRSHSEQARDTTARNTTTDKDFGDAKEYILALPEPLQVKLCAHGDRQVSSTSSKRPTTPIPLSTSADKHLHPNKLFEQLDKEAANRGTPRNTVLTHHSSIDDSPDASDDFEDEVVSSSSQLSDEYEINEDHVNQFREALRNAGTGPDDDGSDSSSYNPSLAALHRLQSYRSLVGAPPPQPLTRAGTLTRPKTPVATMRDMYDMKTASSKATKRTTSRSGTVSTQINTTANSSDRQSSQSSATSPAKPSPQPFNASSLSLLPVPLRIHHSPEARAISNSTRRNSAFKEELDGVDIKPPINRDVQNILEEEERINRLVSTTTRSFANKSRPPPLTLAASARLPPYQRTQDLKHSPISSNAPTLRRTRVPSMQASSIYSRDTQGLSIARTPATPDFPHIAGSFRPPFSPCLPSTVGDTTDSDKSTETSLIRKKPSSNVGTAHQKVENWNVDTSDFNFHASFSPFSPTLKHALSSRAANCQSIHDTAFPEENEEDNTEKEEHNRHRHSVISTEINPSEARLSILISSPLRASLSIDAAAALAHRDNNAPAPGYTDWV